MYIREIHVNTHIIYMFVCLTLLASFFLPSHLSFKNMYMYICTCTYVHEEAVVMFSQVFTRDKQTQKSKCTHEPQGFESAYSRVIIWR